ncbi:alkaline phytoceramidase [Cryphonectria parasitica EP155]|uniref:Alkaline phytoceramidase n=1 Tax=Cryphonectria parasitica (strain ATCC 38755 / EP155) TaxID=660469 RepID=A0A9P5CP15_CRYP1|nr:alkaline phytoceramidase [Cryphonectria parasitica EP155]KAF3764912.1 alkaline phytoceramidase [Cryphonectria parasitica EP155]
MSLAFQWPYRESRDGIWGTQTSTLNWCEEDYNVTPYIAEFFNTSTNLIFLYLGVMGIRECLRHGHGLVFVFSFLGYVVVGLGSMAFHATLKYSMQLADELPMIYTTCIVAYATFSYSRPRHTQVLVALGLLALASWITIYYLSSQDPVFHQVAYAALMLALVFRAMFDMEATLRPALRKRCETPAEADEILRQMWKMAFTGIVLFLVGFSIWLLDNTFCRHLRDARNTILLPWAAVLEGHAWWHIFTGIGTYYCITWRLWLERCLDGGEREFVLKWPSPFTSVPKAVPRAGSITKVNGNGYANAVDNRHKKTL